jgi:hypothetical protein
MGVAETTPKPQLGWLEKNIFFFFLLKKKKEKIKIFNFFKIN